MGGYKEIAIVLGVKVPPLSVEAAVAVEVEVAVEAPLDMAVQVPGMGRCGGGDGGLHINIDSNDNGFIDMDLDETGQSEPILSPMSVGGESDGEENTDKMFFGGGVQGQEEQEEQEEEEQPAPDNFADHINTSRQKWSKVAGAVSLFGARWRAHVDENTDYVYYEDASTGHVQWQRPEGFDGDDIEGHLHQD